MNDDTKVPVSLEHIDTLAKDLLEKYVRTHNMWIKSQPMTTDGIAERMAIFVALQAMMNHFNVLDVIGDMDALSALVQLASEYRIEHGEAPTVTAKA